MEIIKDNGKFFIKREITDDVVSLIKKISENKYGMIEYRGSNRCSEEEVEVLYRGVALGLIQEIEDSWHESYTLTEYGDKFYNDFIK